MVFRVLLLAFFAVLAACSSADFRRLAPPGIIKYERIADKKNINPAIAEEVLNYKANTKAEFPKLGETPAGRVKKNVAGNVGTDAVDTAIGSLADQRDMLQESVSQDRDAVQNEEAARNDANSLGVEFAEDLEPATSAAERE